MRYLVIRLVKIMLSDVSHESEAPSEEDDEVVEVDAHSVTLCADSRAVAACIRKIVDDKRDWALFEVVGDRTERRAVVFKRDGKVSYDVEIS